MNCVPSLNKVVIYSFRLDEGLFEADRLSNHSPEWSSFLVEMKGQLFYLIAVLLMKKANKVSNIGNTGACNKL